MEHLSEKQALGSQLFSDPHLSADGTISCASCHPPGRYFMDGMEMGKGIAGKRSFRNTPSLLNVAYLTSLFWDGRSDRLETQLLGPLTNPREHGLASSDAVVAKVHEIPAYVSSFSHLYGTTRENLGIREIADAIARYERTLLSGNSPFDRYFYGGDRSALSASARRGLELFRGRAGCAGCHQVGEHSALFTDQAFHRSPEPLTESVTKHLSELAQKVVAAKHQGGMALDRLTTDDPNIAELGRFLVTLDPADIGDYRTPSLRNVAMTAPYMHDGHYQTLDQVIDAELYVRSGTRNYPIILTVEERGDLLEFLKSLTS